MKSLAIAFILAGAVLAGGCRTVSLCKSVARNQYKTAQGIRYSDSLITDDGKSRLTRTIE